MAWLDSILVHQSILLILYLALIVRSSQTNFEIWKKNVFVALPQGAHDTLRDRKEELYPFYKLGTLLTANQPTRMESFQFVKEKVPQALLT